MFLIAFYPTSADKNTILNLNKDLNKIKLSEFETKEKEIGKYINLYLNLTNKFYKFNNSSFFKAILKESQEENIEKKLNDTEESFKTLKNLLDENYVAIDNNLLNIIFKTIKNLKSLKKDMEFLKQYFNIQKDTEKIETTIMILSSQDRMKMSLQGILYLFDELNIQKGDFSNKLNEILGTLNDKLEIEQLSNYVGFLKEAKIDVMGEKPYMVVLNQLTNKRDLIPFIKDKDVEGIRNLAEFVGEDDNSSLKASDIQDFIKCVEFIQELKKDSNLPDKEFFDKFIEMSQNNKYKNIEAYIQKVNQNFYEIKDLYTKNIDKSEFTKQKVRDINANSIFKITFDGSEYNCSVSIIGQDQKYKTISYEEVLEVRDRALLKKKDEDDKDNFYELAQKFSVLINNIDTLFDFIIEISDKGYPEDMKYDIFVVNGSAKINKNEISKTIQHIRGLLDKQNTLQKEYYSNCPLIRFLYGKHFSLFNKFLRFRSVDLTHLLQYITNNNYKKIEYNFNKTNDTIKDTLENTNQFLNKLFEQNNISKDIIFKNSLLKNIDNKGLKSHFTSRDEMEKDVIRDFQFLTGNSPSPQSLLMCNEETTSEEITAFLYKAILCEYSALFVVMKIESLEVEIRQDIIDILNTLFLRNRKNMKSCLLFIYDDMTTDIINEIKKINGHSILDIKTDNEVKINDDTIEVFVSNASGVGKSTLIKDNTEKNNKKYIYFPVGGEFTREEVIKRLQNLEIDENTVIHLDLCDTSKVNLMKEFLFSLLITKWYSRGENIFYLGNKINIKIEIPYGFIDFNKKFPILTLFKQTIISIEQLPKLKVPDQLSSNMQIACNYLKFFQEKKN
jgi:hypothetical protein